MSSTIIPLVQKKKIAQLLSDGKRLDGRGLTDYRAVQLGTGIIGSAEGSARIRLGKTEVLVGIKVEVGTPFSDTTNDGVIQG